MTTKKTPAKRRPSAPPDRPSTRSQEDAYDECSDIGNDEHEEDDVSVVKINGQFALIPESIRRLEPRSQEYMADLQHLVMDRIKIANQIDALVDESRSAGVSWVAIGWSVGTTAEAARQRWGVK
jgi:hypothetical protein